MKLPHLITRSRSAWVAVCALGLMPLTTVADTVMVRPEYPNELKNSDNPDHNPPSAVAVFGGHLGVPAAHPPSAMALLLDGVDDVVRIPGFGAAVPTNEVTVELWIKVESLKVQSTFALEPNPFPGNSFDAMVGYADGRTYWDFGRYYRLSYTPPAPIAATWQHYAFVSSRSLSGMWIYRNGIMEASRTGSASFTRGVYDLLIGNLTRGQIAEFRIWNRARASEEIQADMNRRLTGTEADLVAYWPFDEVAGTTVHDTTGHGYDGLLENGPQRMPLVLLVESSFGQPLAPDNPFPNFVVRVVQTAQEVLYPPPGASRETMQNGPFPGDKPWAFRYKRLLYDSDAVASEFEGDWFGPAERAQADAALSLLHSALFFAPWDRDLRHSYLDLFYDIGLAELQGVKNDLNQLARFRLDPNSLPEGKPVINAEIETYTNVLVRLDHALTNYSFLLGDQAGIDITIVDFNAVPGTPFGYYVFQQEQPSRNQYAAQFTDSSGVVRTVPDLDPQTGQPMEPSTEPRELAAGYKDYLFAITLLRDLTSQGAELARLYATRGQPQDVTAGYELIASLQQRVPADLEILNGMFPEGTFPPEDPSGVRAAIDSVGVALADLSHIRSFLDGEANPLGLDPDFLVLVKESLVGGSQEEDQPFDSFDALRAYLKAVGTGPLPLAQATFTEALTSYNNYREKADTVDEELSDVEDTYADRHFEITGYHPDDPDFPNFKGANPKPGSELYQSLQIVTNLQERIRQLAAIGAKIQEQQANAEALVKEADNKDEEIEQAVTMYTSRINSAYDTIADARTAIVAAEAAAKMAEGIGSMFDEGSLGAGIGTLVGGGINAGVQIPFTRSETFAERDLASASARYDADLAVIDVQENVIQARDNLNNAVREEMSNALEIRDIQFQIAQEIAQQAALQRELERIRQNRASSVGQVRNRYYADPVHFLRSRSAMLRAEQAFRRAQRWVYFTQRALEYKWNTQFQYAYPLGGRTFDRQDVFRARNAQELEAVVAALEDFNAHNLGSFNRDWRKDRISFRDDVLLPFTAGGVDSGLRQDPTTLEWVTKAELFRRYLRGQNGLTAPFVSREAGYLVLKLNTFTLKKQSGTLFTGPEYDTNGVMRSLGKWLDKIDWLKFAVVTSNLAEHVTAKLSYGGTCYIRSETPPCFEDGGTSLPGAYTQYPFQFFFKDGANWTSVPFQADDVSVYFATSSGEPASEESQCGFLKERSVAATDVRLTIRLDRLNLNEIQDIEIWIRHFVATTEPNLNCYEP